MGHARWSQISLSRKLKFQQLRVFECALDTGSFQRTATEMALTQPAITKVIHELESHFGGALFERSSRGVRPTELGTVLGRRVKIIMAEFKQLADEVNAFIDGTNGHLVVGCAVAASAKLLPMTLNALKARVPDVLVTIREVHSAHLYAALSMGEIDIVVGRLPEQIVQGAPTIDGCALRHEILFEESMCLVGGVRHWSAGGALPRPFDLQDIGKAPWILPVPESPSRMAVENYFRRAGLPMPRDVIESPSMLNNIGLMLETPRIALMSRSAIKPFAEAGLLCILAEDVAGSFGAVGFSVRADRALKPSCQIFIECLRQVATQA